MGGLRDSLRNWMFPGSERGGSSMSDDEGRHAPREDQRQPTRESDPAPSEPPNPPEPAHRVTEESPELIVMPQGPETLAGRYPGYKPAQAMAAFLYVPDLHRLSYDVLSDSCWGIDGGEYELVLGCFAEPDETPVIVVTYLDRCTG